MQSCMPDHYRDPNNQVYISDSTTLNSSVCIVFPVENMIYKGLDEEEAGFLNQVVNRQAELQVHNMRREIEEVSEYRVSQFYITHVQYCY